MQVYLWGANTHYQIRPSHKKRIKIPHKVSLPISIHTVCFSKSSMMVLSTHGDLYQYKSPTDLKRVHSISSVTKLKSGDHHFAAITSKKQLYTWGIGVNGCLGMDPVQQQQTPFKVAANIIDVFCGPSNTFLKNDSNQIYGCGNNSYGQLGVGCNTQYQELTKVKIDGVVVDIACDSTHTMFLTSEGEIYVAGQNKGGCLGLDMIGGKINTPTKIESQDKFTSIACGGYSVAINDKGSILCWGFCPSGLITTPTVIDKISKKFVEVRNNKNNYYALSQDGELWVWGDNRNGELGVGDTEERNKPFPVILLEEIDINRVFVGMESVLCIGKEREQGGTFKRECSKSNRGRNSNPTIKSLRVSLSNNSPAKMMLINPKGNNSNTKVEVEQIKEKEFRQTMQPKLQQLMRNKQLMKQTIKEQLKQYLKQSSNCYKVANKLISNKCPIKVIDQYCDRESFAQQQFQGTYSSIPHYQNNLSKRQYHKHPSFKQEQKYYRDFEKSEDYNHQHIEQILAENRELKQIIDQKDAIIEDIVGKIQALEDAIDERDSRDQITLREHIDKEVQRMENRYIGEISKLSGVIEGFALRYNTETTTAYDTLVDKERYSKENTIKNVATKCKSKHINTEQQPVDPNQGVMHNNLTLNPQPLEQWNPKEQKEQAKNTRQIQLQVIIKQLESRIESLTESFQSELQSSIRELDMYKHKVRQLNRIVREKNQQIEMQTHPCLVLQNLSPNTEESPIREGKRVIKLRETQNGRENNHIGRVIESIESNKRKISLSADKLIHILEST